jgi:hypothetical protein
VGTDVPRNDESAGKRRTTRISKDATWFKTTLVTAAWSAVRKVRWLGRLLVAGESA